MKQKFRKQLTLTYIFSDKYSEQLRFHILGREFLNKQKSSLMNFVFRQRKLITFKELRYIPYTKHPSETICTQITK